MNTEQVKEANVGKCGHSKCAGGKGCYMKGRPMREWRRAMLIDEVRQAKSAEEARQYAIDWQNWQSEQTMYWSEVAEWADTFRGLATKYPELLEEFEENGII